VHDLGDGHAQATRSVYESLGCGMDANGVEEVAIP
jgi:hypothetical protein